MSRSSPARVVIDWIAVIALAGVFVYASVPKIRDPLEFASDIRNYKFLPPWSSNLFALLFPWWELLAAVAILTPSRAWRRAGAVMTLIMGLMFVVAVVRALILGLDISCGCFGHAGSSKIGLETLAIDTGVIVASLYVLRSTFRPTDAVGGFPVMPASG